MKLILAFRNFADAHRNYPTELLCISLKKNYFQNTTIVFITVMQKFIRTVTNESFSNK